VSRNARFQLALFALFGGFISAGAADSLPSPATSAAARVVIVQGETLLHAFLPDDGRVADAFNRGLTNFTRAADVTAAWRSLVTTNDTVGIKVFSEPGQVSGSRAAVVAAIARGLLAAGIPAPQIVIWDRHAGDLQRAGFFELGEKLGIPVAGAAESGGDEQTFYLPDSPVTGALVWGDHEFGNTNAGVGKKSFVFKLVSRRLTKIISVVPLMNESSAGVCGHLFSLTLGSVDNIRRFEGSPERLALALPEIYALPAVGDHVVLNVTDALLGQCQGGPSGYLQFSTVLNQLWFSRDPVALDTLALQELARERQREGLPVWSSNAQLYSTANLLQLGECDPAKIQVEKIP
jgi:hypothetical protein